MNTKHLIYIVLPLLAAAFLAGCRKETAAERPVVKIDYAFTSEGEKVDTLEFSSLPQTSEVGIVLNNQDLRWTVTSDKSWCAIENATGRGDGTFNIVLSSNESFSPRDTATLTFQAGSYTGAKCLKVVQIGTDFILSQSLMLSSKSGQVFKNVTVRADTSSVLTVNCPQWISCVTTRESVSKSIRVTYLTFTTEANEGAARNGRVYFSADGGLSSNASAYFHQFGNEMNYNEAGNMLMPAGRDSTFSFDVPNDLLDLGKVDAGHSGKTYVSISAKVGSSMTTVSVTFADNKNDCMENRTATNMFLTLYNKAKAVIPAIYQPYESCWGINTANGFLNFAKTVNTGGDISPWMKDGTVHILKGIDMTSVAKSWPGVGTLAHPFTGKFDGGYYPLSNFASQNPVFGVCEGASINAVSIDESSKFLFSEDPTSETGIALAALAGRIYGTTLTDCTSSAAVTLSKPVPGENVRIFVAGIAGYADAASSLKSCSNNGKITAGAGLETSTSDTLYVGGIAGYSGAGINGCTNDGAIADGAVAFRHFVGGVAGDSDGVIQGCTNSGAIETSSVRINPNTGETDQSRYFQTGGIAGCSSADISGCSNTAAINNGTNVKNVEIGGVAGVIDCPGLALSGNSNAGAISSTAAVRYLTIGGLYGMLDGEQNLKFPSGSETSTGDVSITEIESASMSLICAGGYVGAAKNAPLVIENATWTHTIGVSLLKSAHTLVYSSIGGILGGSYNPSATDSKPADVTLSNCQCTNGQLNLNLSSSYAYGARIGAVAGIAGTINGNATLTNCITTGTIFAGAGTTTSSGKQNGYSSVTAGIVGCVFNGNATLKGCTNNAGMRNWTYNNQAWESNYAFESGLAITACNVTAGIIGEYLGPLNAGGYKMTVEDCSNSGYVYSYRGLSGGICGYVRDASFSNCSNTGSLGSGNRSYIGGVLCLGNNVSVTGCSAICPLTGQSAGSETYSAGGIIAIAQGTGSIKGCSYYGDITCNAAATAGGDAYGAVVGNTIPADASDVPAYSVSASKWGGKLSGLTAEPVELTSDNYMSCAAGSSSLTKGTVTVGEDCEWWDGK